MTTADNPLAFDIDALETMAAEAAVDKLLVFSLETNCSDVFLFTESATITLTVRRHGRMSVLGAVSLEFGRHMIGTIKAAADMDIVALIIKVIENVSVRRAGGARQIMRGRMQSQRCAQRI